jgi:hypothetical protein
MIVTDKYLDFLLLLNPANRAGGVAQPYSNTTQDAPPGAVSRVGCCELSLVFSHYNRSHKSRLTMAACSPPDITVRLWTPLNQSDVLLSLYYQWFRPCTILVRALHAALQRA